MKTKHVILLTTGILFVLISCSKQNDQIPDAKSNSGSGRLKEAGCPDYYTLLNEWNPPFLWCRIWGCNCGPTIIVRGEAQADHYSSFFSAALSGSGNDIATFFNSSNDSIWSSLFPYISSDTSLLRKLRSGLYTISITTIDSTHTTIFVLHNKDNSDYFGIPVKH